MKNNTKSPALFIPLKKARYDADNDKLYVTAPGGKCYVLINQTAFGRHRFELYGYTDAGEPSYPIKCNWQLLSGEGKTNFYTGLCGSTEELDGLAEYQVKVIPKLPVAELTKNDKTLVGSFSVFLDSSITQSQADVVLDVFNETIKVDRFENFSVEVWRGNTAYLYAPRQQHKYGGESCAHLGFIYPSATFEQMKQYLITKYKPEYLYDHGATDEEGQAYGDSVVQVQLNSARSAYISVINARDSVTCDTVEFTTHHVLIHHNK